MKSSDLEVLCRPFLRVNPMIPIAAAVGSTNPVRTSSHPKHLISSPICKISKAFSPVEMKCHMQSQIIEPSIILRLANGYELEMLGLARIGSSVSPPCTSRDCRLRQS
jgi:hypothetical protein